MSNERMCVLFFLTQANTGVSETNENMMKLYRIWLPLVLAVMPIWSCSNNLTFYLSITLSLSPTNYSNKTSHVFRFASPVHVYSRNVWRSFFCLFKTTVVRRKTLSKLIFLYIIMMKIAVVHCAMGIQYINIYSHHSHNKLIQTGIKPLVCLPFKRSQNKRFSS